MNGSKIDQIHERAKASWKASGCRGTIEMITGIGKMKIALDLLSELPLNSRVLFLAETRQREVDLNMEKAKWGYKGPKIEFLCYQSACKLEGMEYDMVVSDEIHDSLTPVYSKFYFNNKYKKIIGLTATVDREALALFDEQEEIYKGELIKKIAPVCYSYTLDMGQMDETSRKLNIYVIYGKLDDTEFTVKCGSAKRQFYQTEKRAYDYWDGQFKRAMYLNTAIRELMIVRASSARAKVLYNLKSKQDAVKQLLPVLKGKTIVFGNSLESLKNITPHCINGSNSDEENLGIRKDFEEGRTDIIASFKMLKQGVNLEGLDNCVIMSYYSKEKDLIQRVGRLRNNGEVGNIFIFVTAGTQEEVWFNKMITNINSIRQINCSGIPQCIKKYVENQKQ